MSRKLLKFYADWCSPCKLLDPVVKEFCEEYDIELINVNIEERQDLVMSYNIRSVPTVVLLENGAVLGTRSGMQSANTLRDWLFDE